MSLKGSKELRMGSFATEEFQTNSSCSDRVVGSTPIKSINVNRTLHGSLTASQFARFD